MCSELLKRTALTAVLQPESKMTVRSLKEAIASDPRGRFCNKCHAENFHWDDCGWWYNYLGVLPHPHCYGLDFDKNYLPVCEKCNTTPPGDR